MNKFIGWIIAAGLLIWVLFKEFQPVVQDEGSVVNNYFYDTTEHTTEHTVTTQPVFISSPVIPKLDSAQLFALVREYMSTYLQKDTITDDSLTVFIEDSITRNRVFHRRMNYKFLFPVLKETIITKPPEKRVKLFVGTTIGLASDVSFTPSVALLTKRENVLTVGTDLLSGERNLTVGYFAKISTRKK